ncbi:hypothetical protein ACF3M2_16850 [Tissierella carlieri]
MRFKQCTMKEELLESRMGRELTIEKEVVILSEAKNHEDFVEVGGSCE